MQVYMSAATVLGSTGVRAGVRHCGHDPIVGGKSSAKLGYKVKCPELGTCVGTEYQHYAHRTHSFTNLVRQCCDVRSFSKFTRSEDIDGAGACGTKSTSQL